MQYSIFQIADVLEVNTDQLYNHMDSLSIALIDSRQLSIPSQTIFFALRGERKQGTDYIPDLYAKGVRHYVIDQYIDQASYPKANFLVVSDVLEALQKLAKWHRLQFDIPVVAITGSNGKTIVKEWLYDLFRDQLSMVRSPKSYNSQVGVPLSLLQIENYHDVAIIEAGISKPGEMIKLASMIQPTHGIITNIGSAHDEGFSDQEQKLHEKLLLFNSCELVVCCADHSDIKQRLYSMGIPSICWSLDSTTEADIHFEVKRVMDNSCMITQMISSYGLATSYRFRLSDSASLENFMHIVSLASLFGWSLPAEKVSHLESVNMRLEVVQGSYDTLIVHDAYNMDITSLTNALGYCDRLRDDKDLHVVITDMDQTGLSSAALRSQVRSILQAYPISRLYTIGHEFESLSSDISSLHFRSTEDLIAYFNKTKMADTVLLVKGARRFRLEGLVQYLQEKDHEAFLEVNFGALARNFKVFERLIPRDTMILVMVKADAYGAGAVSLSKFFESRQIDYLGVAYIDEGVELRRSGIDTSILVLNPERSAFTQLVEHDLEPELYSFSILQDFVSFCRQKKITQYPVHINIDTGMKRLGFEEKDVAALQRIITDTPEIHITSIFTHLTSSDDPTASEHTHHQVELYTKIYDQLTSRLSYRPLRHVLNSHGVIHYPQYSFDMVRLGIGVYGYISTSSQAPVILEHVHALKARISQIKTLDDGDTVGYSREGRGKKGMRIATVNMGYADGIFRSLGNKRFSLKIHDQLAPICGNVCMDMCMVDISQIPDCMERDEVIVFDKDYPIEVMANAANTIPYEILTAISERVKKVYLHD